MVHLQPPPPLRQLDPANGFQHAMVMPGYFPQYPPPRTQCHRPELHNVNFFTQIISVQLNLPQEKARKLREVFDI